MFKKKIMAGVLSAAMVLTAAPVTALANDVGQKDGVTTWKTLYEQLIPGFSASTEAGYYDAVTSATNFTSHHASGNASGIPAVVSRVVDGEGKTTALDGVTAKMTKGKKVALGSATHQTFEGKQANKTYGTDEFVVCPDEKTEGYVWNEYLSNIYAVTISDGTNTAGAVPWIDFYGEPATQGAHYNKVEIALNNGSVVADNKALVNRYAAFYGADGDLKAGKYTVTVYAEGYNELAAEITVKKKSHAKLTLQETNEATSTNASIADLPKDFDAEYQVDGKDAKLENGKLTFEAVLPGSHNVTVNDKSGTYDPVNGSFAFKTTQAAAQFDAKEKKLTGAEGSAYTLENYIGAITKVNVNGTDYNAAGRGAVKVIGADGTIDLSKTVAADTKEAVDVMITASGYPDLKFTIPAEKNEGTGSGNEPQGTVKPAGNDSSAVKPAAAAEKKTAAKQDQKMIVKAAVKTIKSKKLKKKKQVIKGVFSVKNAMGKVTYKAASKSKVLSVNKKNGNITVKKKTKKGTYKFKVAITAAGSELYNAASKTVTVKIRVK